MIDYLRFDETNKCGQPTVDSHDNNYDDLNIFYFKHLVFEISEISL